MRWHVPARKPMKRRGGEDLCATLSVKREKVKPGLSKNQSPFSTQRDYPASYLHKATDAPVILIWVPTK